MSHKNKQQRPPQAFYARGILTLDIPTAREPVLWRQEIKKAANISFALHELPQGGRSLILRAGEGSAEQIIATFDAREAADTALDVLRTLLLKKRRGGFWNFVCTLLKWLMIWLIISAVDVAILFAVQIVAVRSSPVVTQSTLAVPSPLPPSAQSAPPQSVEAARSLPAPPDNTLQAPKPASVPPPSAGGPSGH